MARDRGLGVAVLIAHQQLMMGSCLKLTARLPHDSAARRRKRHPARNPTAPRQAQVGGARKPRGRVRHDASRHFVKYKKN
jgi:hypothetical protein